MHGLGEHNAFHSGAGCLYADGTAMARCWRTTADIRATAKISRAPDVVQKSLDIRLDAARMLKQTVGVIEHLIRGGVSGIGVPVEVDDICGHRARTIGGRLGAGQNSGGLGGLLPDPG